MPSPSWTVAVTRPLPDAALAGLPADATTRVWPGPAPPDPADVRVLCDGADAVIAFAGDVLDATWTDAVAERVRVVAYVTAGVDGADLAALAAAGVPITHARKIADAPTADLTFALLLALQRRITAAERWVRDGGWTAAVPPELYGRDVHGSTLGLVGFGAIARAVARRAAAFGMSVQHHDRSRSTSSGSRWVELDELLATSDVVSLHVPLTDATRGMIGADQLARMRADAVLLNTARGEVVDTDALVAALGEGTIAGAALDVTDPEPLPTDHPLLASDRCIVVPHVGTAIPSVRAAMVRQAVANVVAVLAGDPPLSPLTD